jgi:hypothetical protein
MNPKGATVTLSCDQLYIICTALNELCLGNFDKVEDLTDIPKEIALRLLERLVRILEKCVW